MVIVRLNIDKLRKYVVHQTFYIEKSEFLPIYTIRITAQEALSGVDTTRGSWETPLALGIVLLVISIALIVVYFVAKKKRDKYTDYKAELHKQRLLLDKQIDIKLKEKENENDNA